MKKLLLALLISFLLFNQTQAQSLGHITILYAPPCEYVGLVDSIVLAPVPGVTYYHWFSPVNTPTLLDGHPLPYDSPDNVVVITFTGTQQQITLCVYGYNSCCYTDTACFTMYFMPPMPVFDPANSSTALPNSSGTYAVLPSGNPCVDECHWTFTGDGTITGNGNNSITLNFGPSFTTGLLCAHFTNIFNFDGPDTCMTITIATGIESVISNPQSAITISPSPFTDQLIITNKNNEEGEIILYDIAGRIVARTFLPIGQSRWGLQLSSGMYVYEVRNKKEVLKQGKVVKQ